MKHLKQNSQRAKSKYFRGLGLVFARQIRKRKSKKRKLTMLKTINYERNKRKRNFLNALFSTANQKPRLPKRKNNCFFG